MTLAPEAPAPAGTPGSIPQEIAEEIAEFERRTEDFLAGDEEEDTFKGYRLSYGIYGQRQAGYQMVRVKIPHGRLNGRQLEALADFSEQFCDTGEYPGGGGRGMGHITTRQDMQFHFVRLRRVPEAMRHLAQAGLTTREACFNTVRNITGCPIAGACANESFDITPYAQAATELFLRNPFCQNLPRKFKVSFSGCVTDCALGAMHDIGAVARVVDGERGFRLWVGGGLGNTPRPAQLLYDFVSVANFYPTLEAIVRVYDEDGPRKNRNRARIKFFFDKMYTADTFRERIEGVRESLPRDARCFAIAASLPQRVDREAQRRVAATAGGPVTTGADVARGIAYARWKATNVGEHRDPAYAIVTVRLTLGDITADQLRVMAQAARRFSDDEVRASVRQNLVFRDVRREDLGALHDVLEPAGLAQSEALGFRDVVTCPGGDTCNLGITSSRGLGRAVGRWLDENRLHDLPEFAGTTLNASGCPNSCSQHHISTIGFYGNNKNVGDDPTPHYMMLLGGGVGEEGMRVGRMVMRIPAKRVPVALDRLVGEYRRQREGGELFATWIDRADEKGVKTLLEDLALSDTPTAEELFDWDQETPFTGKTGEGECAAV